MNRLAASTWFCTALMLGPAWPGTGGPFAQEPSVDPQAKPEAEAERAKALEIQVTKALEAIDLTPPPAFEAPDPPPHEGAMISLPPHVIEPPDLVRVEVLDALEGRPIRGERLVRPDGKIALGFYGEVDVRGLTIEQARIKIVKHLRTYINDELLGLTTVPSPPIAGTIEAEGREGTAPPPDVAPREKAPAEVHPQAGPAPAATRRLRKIADSPTERSMRRWQVMSGTPTGYFSRRSLWNEEPSKSQEAAPPIAAPTPTPMVLHPSCSSRPIRPT